MKLSVVVAFTVGGLAFAGPGRYEGKGTIGIPGKAQTEYKLSSTVVELDPKKSFEVTEVYDDGVKPAVTVKAVYHFAANGTIKIVENNVEVGCGYCVPQPDESKWCDYTRHTPMGKLHVSMYYNAATKTNHRMGDIVSLEGVQVWSDNVKLVE